jgi:tetraacyldisaccharide-1-P 4'-kinase
LLAEQVPARATAAQAGGEPALLADAEQAPGRVEPLRAVAGDEVAAGAAGFRAGLAVAVLAVVQQVQGR